MATLQASLLSKPLLFPFLIPNPNHSTLLLKPLHFNPTRLHPRVPFTPLLCTFQPDNTTLPHSEPNPEPISDVENESVTILDSNSSNESNSRFEGVGGESVEKKDGRLPIVVFLIGLWVRAKEGLKRAFSELVDWWPFWRQEKLLAKLITEADANRLDAAKQTALFVELNKHRFCEFQNLSF